MRYRPLTLLTLVGFATSLQLGYLSLASAAVADLSSANEGSKELSSSQPLRSLSLSQSFELADSLNKDITVAKWNLPIAQGVVRAAGANPNPQALVQTGFGHTFTYLFTGQTQQYGLIQQFQTAGKRTKKIAVARANYGLAELQLDVLRFSIHNRVRRAYCELSAAEIYQSLIESQRQVGVKLADISTKRFLAGKVAKSDVLQANLNVLQFDTQRNQAQGRLQQASAALAAIVGERPEHVEIIDITNKDIFKLSAEKTEVVPSPSRELPDIDKVMNVALASRPDLKAAQQQIYVNTKALTLARTKKIPDIFVGIGGTFSTFAKGQPAGLTSVGNYEGQGGFFSISAENPFFYQYQGEVALAKANLRKAELKLLVLRSQVGVDVVTAYNEVNMAKANILEFQNNLLPTSAEVARIARRGYLLGSTELSAAIVAQQQYQQTLGDYYDAVVDYQNAWADLEYAVGVPLVI